MPCASLFKLSLMILLSSTAQLRAEILPAETSSIEVKSVVEIAGLQTEILLGDLIIAHGLKHDEIEELAAIRLADMPNPGESRSFTALGLEQVFRPELRDIEAQLGHPVGLRIPARVIVTRKGFRLTEADIKREIMHQLEQLCRECSFEITALSLPLVAAKIPDGAQWALRLRRELPRGSFSAPLEIDNSDGSKRTYWISGTIAISRKVPVANRQIEAGERLKPEDYTLQTKDVTFATDTPCSEGEFSDSVAARSVQAGQVLWRSLLRREVALKAGEMVKVSAGAGDWSVSIEGVAQSAAFIGDTVNVKIPRTSKLVSGLLKEKGLVEVRQ